MATKIVFPNEDFLKLGLKIIEKLSNQANISFKDPRIEKIEVDYDNIQMDAAGETELVDVTVTFSSQSISFTVKEEKRNPPIGSV